MKKFALISIITVVLFSAHNVLASITLSDPDNTNAPNLAITLTVTSPDTVATGVIPQLKYYDFMGGQGALETVVPFTDMTGGVWKASFSFTCTASTTGYRYFAFFGTYTSGALKDLCTEGSGGGQQNPPSGAGGGQQNSASGSCQNGGVLCNPINVSTLTDFIAKVLNIVVTLGFPIIALAIIYAGFLFVTAQGNSEKLETAKKTLLYTIIGAAILLGSWIIASAIGGTIAQLKG